MNESEKLIAKLCKKTFLSLWSYPTPQRLNNRGELCDLLVICNPYIIIFSVKDISVKESKDYQVDVNRWIRKAIEKSYKQIYGAEGTLEREIKIQTKDGQRINKLPKIIKDNIFRVAIAIGRGERLPLIFGDFGKGFVHVLDELSLEIVLNELDTLSDFISYLEAKELYFKVEREFITKGEEDLLAVYLQNGRKFPENYDVVITNGDLWKEFINREDYKAKAKEDKISYVWDRIIEELYNDCRNNKLINQTSLTNFEKALRVMAKENRFSRRILSKTFLEFIGCYGEQSSRSKMIVSELNTVYVFLVMTFDEEDREVRMGELIARCFVAKGLNKNTEVVIGIATEEYRKGRGHSYDICYLEKPRWTKEDTKKMKEIQEKFGYFKDIEYEKKGFDEYPKCIKN